MRQGFLRRGENGFDVLEHAAQIAPADPAEDINYRHDIVVRINGLTVGAGYEATFASNCSLPLREFRRSPALS